MKINDLDTPALVIDLDRVERNVNRWQAFCDLHRVKNRPHIKTHKIPELAKLQVEAGACGVTCQKLGEAETMADHGIGDVLLAYNVIGEAKLKRLASLHRRIRLAVVADSEDVVRGLNAAVAGSGKPLPVLVEVVTCLKRCGVLTPEKAASLAKFISRQPGLTFEGFMAYPTDPESNAFMVSARQLAQKEGIEVRVISGGGTPGMWKLPEYSGLTEYRAGTYIYNDRMIVNAGAGTLEDCAMSVLVSVVSTAGADWVVVDGGTKTFTTDQYGLTGFGVGLEDPGILLARCSEEHGMLTRDGKKPDLALGAKLQLVPNHTCVVSNLHETAFLVRGDEVVERWTISARGKVQ